MVSSHEITSKYDVQELKGMIEEHVAYTNSEKGKEILEHFTGYLPKFKKIIPHDYERMLTTILQMEEKGLSSEQAQIEAFTPTMQFLYCEERNSHFMEEYRSQRQKVRKTWEKQQDSWIMKERIRRAEAPRERIRTL